MAAVVIYEDPCRGDHPMRGVYLIPDSDKDSKDEKEIIKDCLYRRPDSWFRPDSDTDREEMKKEVDEGQYSLVFIDAKVAPQLLDMPIDTGTDSGNYAVMKGWLALCRRFEVS